MPNTFCHPAAVLGFGRWSPRWLSFAGLVCGSMAPDAGYFVRQFALAREAHGLLGSVTLALPAGLAMLALFYLLRQPLCFLLPDPHRGAMWSLAITRPTLSLRHGLRALLSVYIGIWTHIIWDAFTHDGTIVVRHIALLREPVFHVADADIPIYNVLQHLSTLIGLIIIVVVYLRWLRRHPGTAPASRITDRTRYILIALACIIALAIGIPAAIRTAAAYHGYLALRVLVVRTAIYTSAALIPTLLTIALPLWHWARRSDTR